MRIPIESSTSYRGRNSRPNWLILAAFVARALAAGAIGAVFSPAVSAAANHWYAMLAKPAMGAAGQLVRAGMDRALCHDGHVRVADLARALSPRPKRGACGLCGPIAAQCRLGAAFFRARNIGAGLFVIVALWLAIAWTMREFAAVKAAAAWMLAPYLIWVGFASALNFAIWKMNQ